MVHTCPLTVRSRYRSAFPWCSTNSRRPEGQKTLESRPLSLDRRRVIHFNVTDSPAAEWTSLQIVQAFPFDTAPQFLIRDRDAIYGTKVVDMLRAIGIEQIVTARKSPWQNVYVERVIGSVRRECLDHVIVLNQRHLRRILKEYFEYYHEARTHLGLGKDSPITRDVELPGAGSVVAKPQRADSTCWSSLVGAV